MSTIYEQGESVAKRVLGKSFSAKTYAYVADECDNVAKAFKEMLAYIANSLKANILKVDEAALTVVVSGGNSYTLCHEVVDGKQNFKKPCNIIRYVSQKLYTKDSLYIDENGETIDVTHRGVNDIINQVIGFVQGFNEVVLRNPEVIPEMLLAWCGCIDMRLSTEISRNITDIPESTPCFDINTHSAKKLLEFKIAYHILSSLSERSLTYKYLTKRCGLSFVCSFNPSKEPLPKPERFIKKQENEEDTPSMPKVVSSGIYEKLKFKPSVLRESFYTGDIYKQKIPEQMQEDAIKAVENQALAYVRKKQEELFKAKKQEDGKKLSEYFRRNTL